MPRVPAPNPSFIQPTLGCTNEWRFPHYDSALRQKLSVDGAQPIPLIAERAWQRTFTPLLGATYIEWRYYSIISASFHGILGVAFVNPYNRVPFIAEEGMLVILAGMVDAPRDGTGLGATIQANQHAELCYMHLFPTAACTFEGHTFHGEYQGVTLHMEQPTTQQAEINLTNPDGLDVALTLNGLPGFEIPPHYADDLRRVPGAHWTVYCPAPVATTSGRIQASSHFLRGLRHKPDPNRANRISDTLYHSGDLDITWQDASGYYEHSFGLNPLPLHGWDFLFVTDAAHKRGIVMQTYPRSESLRYIETCWWSDEGPQYVRFTADQMDMHWVENYTDPEVGVPLPTHRRIQARGQGLRLEVDNFVTHQIAFLRAHKLAVRHFFISEQIGFCDWRLTTEGGEVLAEVVGQPCGGEVAHFRARAPRLR
ncbi:MAG: hypothetical protein ACLFTK_05380 [Anaerolineales bacterium]